MLAVSDGVHEPIAELLASSEKARLYKTHHAVIYTHTVTHSSSNSIIKYRVIGLVSRDRCITVAQLRTGHSPLLAAYLHRIGRRDSATCPHCNGADETAEHLVLHWPAHNQVQQKSWPNLHYQSDPRRPWSFLERIGVRGSDPSPRVEMKKTESISNCCP